MYTNRMFGTSICVLFIEVSSFQGFLIKGFHFIGGHCYYTGVWLLCSCYGFQERRSGTVRASNGLHSGLSRLVQPVLRGAECG